ncbi:hypothetical protein [Streptomyces sp. NPDC056669]|uniref:hypothetical protein n=1 Tax=unclassified Streptomyces TaxID=2593676 RepID=UPI00369D1661
MRSTRAPQRVPLAQYEESVDPVVLPRGANLHAPLDRDALLPCCAEERLVMAVGPVTALTWPGTWPRSTRRACPP